MKNNADNEIIIDINKILKISWNRKKIIGITYIAVFVLMFIITLFQTKQYETYAQLFVNKSQDTNLLEINPFTIAEGGSMGAAGGGIASLLSSAGAASTMGNEIEILKSPLVMKEVIKENNFKYTKGPKKGKYIDAVAFANSKNLEIDNVIGSKTIKISYKSADPKQAYNVVKSIIKNYKQTYENINSKKATNDKEFLVESYNNAKKELDSNVVELKKFIAQTRAYSNSGIGGTLDLIKLYDKKLSSNMNRISRGSLEGKKLESELDLSIDKIKLIKTKLEWIKLVEALSKDISNITILKEPEVKESFEYSDPNIKINFIIACLVAFSLSCLIVVGFELVDKKLSYYDMNDNTIFIQNNEINLTKLKSKVISQGIKSLAIISLLNDDILANVISKELANLNIASAITNINDSNSDYINIINNSNTVVIIGKINDTNRKDFNEVKEICNDLNKNIICNFFIV